jgi:hypothetical protein
MNSMSHDPFASGAVPEGMRWCPHRSGYGSSLKEASGRGTRCGGSGVVWAACERPAAGRHRGPSPQR